MDKLKGGIIGAGKDSFIGFAHYAAAALYNEAEIIAGVFSSDPDRCIKRGLELGIERCRIYCNCTEMIEKENVLPAEERIDFVIVATLITAL